jgi:hypothetical protein
MSIEIDLTRILSLVYRPNPCDNVYCGFGQCRDGICECHSGYSGAQCDTART